MPMQHLAPEDTSRLTLLATVAAMQPRLALPTPPTGIAPVTTNVGERAKSSTSQATGTYRFIMRISEPPAPVLLESTPAALAPLDANLGDQAKSKTSYVTGPGNPRSIMQLTKPPAPALLKTRATPKLAKNKQSGSIDHSKRPRSGKSSSKDLSTEAKRVFRTRDQRFQLLMSDRFTVKDCITLIHVGCAGCGKNVALDSRGKYDVGLWEKHRGSHKYAGTCKGIRKALQGASEEEIEEFLSHWD